MQYLRSWLCRQNCNTCADGHSGEDCSSCLSTHYKNTQGVCTTLPVLCTSANPDGACTVCNSGYYPKNGNCTQNPFICSEVQNEGATCTLIDGTTAYKLGNKYVATPYESKSTCGGQIPQDGVSPSCAGLVPDGLYYNSLYKYQASLGNDVPRTSACTNGYCNNYWSAAVKYCDSIGMKLPTSEELTTICNECKSNPGKCPASGYYWTATELSDYDVDHFLFSSCTAGGYGHKGNFDGVFCVSK